MIENNLVIFLLIVAIFILTSSIINDINEHSFRNLYNNSKIDVFTFYHLIIIMIKCVTLKM